MTNNTANHEHRSELFGLNTTQENAKVWLCPVPWEVTTSYGSGTSNGPQAILEASPQIDLFDSDFADAYTAGYYLFPENPELRKLNDEMKKKAQAVIKHFNETGETSTESKSLTNEVNAACTKMVQEVYSWSKMAMAQNRIPGVIGGDHSSPLGLIKAVCEAHPDVGILHIDAHADLRNSYQGFTHSHASIMHNVCSLAVPPQKLVQVAIRDYCKEEYDHIQSHERKIRTFFDREIKSQLFAGATWDSLCEKIVHVLPEKVYISFDIDGLSPEFCPSTGTPVPGGLSFDQATHLLSVLHRLSKQVVGFDLNEVTPGKDSQWDGNVGSRILFKLCGLAVS